jgi:disulfide bond formation protein DsbB
MPADSSAASTSWARNDPDGRRRGGALSTQTWSRFFTILAFVCAAGAIGSAMLLAAIRRPARPTWVDEAHDTIADVALWLAATVAIVTTAGSLYYSLGAHYVPCELCWYQRICMYPLSAMLLIAALRRDVGVARYAAPLVTVGVVIAAYHTQLQAFPDQRTFCDPNNPCSSRYVWEFGFVSLPLMALVAFCCIGVLLAICDDSTRIAAKEAP